MTDPVPAALTDLPLPAYDAGGLAGVLPRVLASIGGPHAPDAIFGAPLPPAQRAVVVLADGLGLELLKARSGHAPFLRKALAGQPAEVPVQLTCGFPSTTATSMGSFGTGLPPGAHGLVGYQVRVPGTDHLFNELDWVDGPDPLQWQNNPTVFERAVASDIEVTMVGPAKFDGSGLTQAALRGAQFRGGRDLADCVDAAVSTAKAARRSLTYLYWGDVDRTGHGHGCDSWQWGDAVELLDRELARLHRSLPAGTSLTITADHGMVDVPPEGRVDIARDAQLREGIELVGGELRSLQLYCRSGAADDVLATWRGRFGDDAWVLDRENAVAAGLFGAVAPAIQDRIGDVIVAMRAPIGAYDSRFMRPTVTGLLGQHGSLTPAETAVPMVHLPTS